MTTKDDNMDDYDMQAALSQDPGYIDWLEVLRQEEMAEKMQEEHSESLAQAADQDLQAAVVGGWDWEKYQEEIYWATEELAYKYRTDENE